MLIAKETRNRDIFAAFQNGRIAEELAQLYELSPVTVRQIVNKEKLKRTLSPLEFYRALRRTEAVAQAKGG